MPPVIVMELLDGSNHRGLPFRGGTLMTDNNDWLRLYRDITHSRVFGNAELLKVWIWCLCRANYTERWVSITTGRGETEVQLNAGQFIFGRHSAAKSLKMKPSSVWKRIKKLETIENLTIESNTHYSVVSICNWGSYQYEYEPGEQGKEQPSDNQGTTKEQPRNTDKNLKNLKKGKNTGKGVDRIKIPEGLNVPEFIAAWSRWKKYRPAIRRPLKPMTLRTQLKTCDEMGVERAVAAIDHTIGMGWQGLRESKERPRDDAHQQRVVPTISGKGGHDDRTRV